MWSAGMNEKSWLSLASQKVLDEQPDISPGIGNLQLENRGSLLTSLSSILVRARARLCNEFLKRYKRGGSGPGLSILPAHTARAIYGRFLNLYGNGWKHMKTEISDQHEMPTLRWHQPIRRITRDGIDISRILVISSKPCACFVQTLLCLTYKWLHRKCDIPFTQVASCEFKGLSPQLKHGRRSTLFRTKNEAIEWSMASGRLLIRSITKKRSV